MPVGGVSAYCAAKSFASYIGIGLNFELKGLVDVLSFEP